MANIKPTTKIIAGIYKGKVLDLPDLEVTRSSKSILKESFFNVLQYDVIDTVFLEAFGGSGSIGLEALSRGAKEAYFCEIDKQSYKILQKNCKMIDESKCTTIFGDTFEKFPQLVQSLTNRSDDLIVYIDPPFDFREGMANIYERSYEMVRNFTNNNIVLITFEHLSNIDLPQTLGRFEKFKNKKFGKSSLTYYRQSE